LIDHNTEDDWIQHRTETSQRGDFCVPHIYGPDNRSWLYGIAALAFHVEGFQYVGGE